MEINASGKIMAANQKAANTEEQKLKKACKDFEAILINQMFESMRKTVPEGGLLEDNQSREIIESMYYRNLSDTIATGKGMGLGDAIFEDLKASLERKKHISDFNQDFSTLAEGNATADALQKISKTPIISNKSQIKGERS